MKSTCAENKHLKPMAPIASNVYWRKKTQVKSENSGKAKRNFTIDFYTIGKILQLK